MRLAPSTPMVTKIARQDFNKSSSYTLLGIDVLREGESQAREHLCAIMLWGVNNAEAESRRREIIRAVNTQKALRDALGYIPEQVDLGLPRFVDADDSDTVAIEVTIGWLREVRDALALVNSPESEGA